MKKGSDLEPFLLVGGVYGNRVAVASLMVVMKVSIGLMSYGDLIKVVRGGLNFPVSYSLSSFGNATCLMVWLA